MTTEYPAPPDPEPWSFGEAVALIVATSDDEGLPFPRGLRDNRPGTQLLVLDFTTLTDAHAWAEFFGIVKWGAAEVGYVFGWHGWTVSIWADAPATPSAGSGSGGIEPSSPSSDPVVTQPTPAPCALADAALRPTYNTAECDGPAVWRVDYFVFADGERQPIRHVAPVCYRHAYNEVRWVNLRKRPEQAEMRPLPRRAPAQATS